MRRINIPGLCHIKDGDETEHQARQENKQVTRTASYEVRFEGDYAIKYFPQILEQQDII